MTMAISLSKLSTTPEGLKNRFLALAFPHCAIWLVSLGLCVFVELWLALDPRISLDDKSRRMIWGGFVIGTLLILTRVRCEPIFNTAIHRVWCVMMMISLQGSYFVAANTFNNLAMSIPFPMADNWLASADKALGFDWNAYATVILSSPTLTALLQFAYGPLTNHSVTILIFLLVLVDARKRLVELLFMLISTGLACILVAAVFPAKAAVATLANEWIVAKLPSGFGTYHIAAVEALRGSGAIQLTVDQMDGLCTFPSFHTCLALITFWTLRGNVMTTTVGAVIAFLIIAATPVFGGHYFVDLLAGAALVATAAYTWKKYVVHRLNFNSPRHFPLPWAFGRFAPIAS